MTTATEAPRVKRYADSIEVRNWATSLTDKEKKDLKIEGIEVSSRGRFHSDLVRAFNLVHRDQGIRYVPISRNQPRVDEVFAAADQGDDDRPTVYRRPQKPKAEAIAVPDTMPTVLAMPGAPEPVMEMLRQGASVIVVYVPLPMKAVA